MAHCSLTTKKTKIGTLVTMEWPIARLGTKKTIIASMVTLEWLDGNGMAQVPKMIPW